MAENAAPKRTPLQRITNYFREARAELSRVTWSTRQEIIEYTQLITLFAIVGTLLLGGIDSLFRWLTLFLNR
ncbi:MAG: preprotein translocase subunit SecE [Meiothermus sp.]|nr:preprotein translocase subunit SecE [Meiothermus sp.]